ncbi:hypothetical protein NST62_06140 [Ureibacillus sp. FSL K6-8385]|uniref:Uncharacterized protein n=1 Tax=Ureibacillus terrenus TaxID=118246 RepID=A0A540V5Z4_9BACL|nr:hypothetical protein [Ureibacillus terrenus]MED3660870.1 hypothetical protein [Ureibacillus terrenus]MED3764631.1 hypothetical protein [Ureibacillus terrenus]TQE92148.1 hypothetical protein FKZ59_00125 [Ureibacillus terrenus]
MHVKIGGKEFYFHRVRIELLETGIREPFRFFDKKTIRDLLQHRRYQHLKDKVFNDYCDILDMPAGPALYSMKQNNDLFYKEFLNNYGDLDYCQFVVKGNESVLNKKGVYTVIMNDKIVFAGICNNKFKLRFNQHIGNVSPKSCFRDGTATHCHINAKIAQHITDNNIHFQVCPLSDVGEMKLVKNWIIDRFEPLWNLRFGSDIIYSYS